MDRGKLIAVGPVQTLLAEHQEKELEELFLRLVGRDRHEELRAYLGERTGES